MSDDQGKGFADMLAEVEGGMTPRSREPRVGEEVTGTVVAVGDEAIFIDLGTKAEAVLERSELDEGTVVKVGDRLRAHVATVRDGQVVLRTKLGRGDDAAELEHAHSHGIPVVGKVSAVNKGGVEVEIGSTRGFCPVSQLDIERVEDAGAWLGRELEFLILQYERARGGGRANVVLSRRSLLERKRAEQAVELLATLEVGSTVKGTVTRIKEFGAFVDLGGIEGLIHRSELGFGRVNSVADVLTEGDRVEAQVLKIEPAPEPGRPHRISLSLRALQPDPFDAAGDSLTKGARRRGKVVRLEPFGAFVELADGLEGLIHVSEITAERRINHPREMLEVGQDVEVCILDVEPERRRIALSMKQVATQTEAAQAADFKSASTQSLGTFADLMKKKLGK